MSSISPIQSTASDMSKSCWYHILSRHTLCQPKPIPKALIGLKLTFPIVIEIILYRAPNSSREVETDTVECTFWRGVSPTPTPAANNVGDKVRTDRLVYRAI